MIAPVHFFDTAFGGLRARRGQGRPHRRRARAGARPRASGRCCSTSRTPRRRRIDDALALARRPVVVSHTGVKGTCDNARNLSDAHLRGVARTGGVIGIGFWETAVCGTRTRDAIARAIRHAVARGRHRARRASGSDFDGAVATPFDAAGLASLTEALLAEGFGDTDIARIMGANAIRVLEEALPARE